MTSPSNPPVGEHVLDWSYVRVAQDGDYDLYRTAQGAMQVISYGRRSGRRVECWASVLTWCPKRRSWCFTVPNVGLREIPLVWDLERLQRDVDRMRDRLTELEVLASRVRNDP